MRDSWFVVLLGAVFVAVAIVLTIWSIRPAPMVHEDPCEYKDWILEELKYSRSMDEPVQRLVWAIRNCRVEEKE